MSARQSPSNEHQSRNEHSPKYDLLDPDSPIISNDDEMIHSKVFVGGLAPTVTHEMLLNYCQNYGAVLDAVVMMDKFTQRSRGFGFITYASPESVDRLMADREVEHVVDGKRVQFKRAVPVSFAYNPEKIFVGGLPGTCDSEKLTSYFTKYGSIIDAQVMYDKSTGRSRGFGYVNYENNGAVEQVLKDFHDHYIDGKWVEVKRCLPNDSRKNRLMQPVNPLLKPVGPGSLMAFPQNYTNPAPFYGMPPFMAYPPYMPYYPSSPYYNMNGLYDPYAPSAMLSAPQIDPYAMYYGNMIAMGKGRANPPRQRSHLGGSFQPTITSPSLSSRVDHAGEQPPTTGEGILDVAAIFSQLNGPN